MIELRRGDLIEVKWLDITEDPVGNPSEATLPVRHSVGYFWGATMGTFVTTGTMDSDVADQSGYVIYPMGVIVGIKRIRKGSKKLRSEPVRFGQRRAAGTFHLEADPDVLPPEAARAHGGRSGADWGQRWHTDPKAVEAGPPITPEDLGG